MNFNAVVDAQNTANGANATQAAADSTQVLGQSDFLKLLTTQLTMQDPSDPVDDKDMITQIAQFSSVAGISQINDTLSAILTKIDALGTTQGTTTSTDPTTTSTGSTTS